jgi:hypothetical protein
VLQFLRGWGTSLPFGKNPDAQNISSYQKFLQFENEKLMFKSRSISFSPQSDIKNLRPEHAYLNI